MGVNERFPYPRPAVRPLKIYAFDPMVGTKISTVTRNEPLECGPMGSRIKVIDYDGAQDCYYTPADLDDPAVLMQGGLDHSEGDPRFHQQMVYAVATRILEIFDRALGRPVRLGHIEDGRPVPLRLFPHAFVEANAYYAPDLKAILFGYFRADASDPGKNLPGQFVFTCLSHDIIAHELTHALIDHLSPTLLEVPADDPNPDTFALHEGLADLVPMLHRFSFESVLRDEIRRTRGRLNDRSSDLVRIASQFGSALGREHGLRNATIEAKSTQYTEVTEPHERGEIFLSAVFDALFETYRARVADLFQIAGTTWTTSDDQELHPDLVNRMAAEAARTAETLLTMCIRAFDYVPPIDLTLGDFLRAVVTADRELAPEDSTKLRANLIEAFRKRGIYATGVRSLAEESLIWDGPDRPVPPLPPNIVGALTRTAQAFRRIRPEAGEHATSNELEQRDVRSLQRYASQNARALKLWPRWTFEISSPRYSFRVSPDGQLVVEIVIQIVQRRNRRKNAPIARGVTVVAAADGTIRYVIPNQKRPPIKTSTEGSDPAVAALNASVDTAWTTDYPFPLRFRMTPAEFLNLHPRLTMTNAELAALLREQARG